MVTVWALPLPEGRVLGTGLALKEGTAGTRSRHQQALWTSANPPGPGGPLQVLGITVGSRPAAGSRSRSASCPRLPSFGLLAHQCSGAGPAAAALWSP